MTIPERLEDKLARRGGVIELLRVPAALFGALARARGALYDRGVLPARRVDVPIVCVGNLTTGGTGKTPLVCYLAHWFERRGQRVGILSRGYRSEKLEADQAGAALAGRAGDEARLYAEAVPFAECLQDANRLRGARALAERGVDVVVLDDGFQHRRLARDLDLVLLDATRPFGLPADPATGRAVRAALPRGLLREAPAALSRAGAIVLTRIDQAEPRALEELRAELQELFPQIPRIECRHRPAALRDGGGERHDLGELKGREVDLISAIGHPAAFEASVESTGARIREHRRYPDHYVFQGEDVRGLGANGVPVVTTAKDAVKLGTLLPAALIFEVELEISSGGPVLEALLESLPPGRARRLRQSLHEGLHG